MSLKLNVCTWESNRENNSVYLMFLWRLEEEITVKSLAHWATGYIFADIIITINVVVEAD